MVDQTVGLRAGCTGRDRETGEYLSFTGFFPRCGKRPWKGFSMKELLTSIVRALVDYPDEVDVKEVEGTRTTVYELRVGEGDLGKVIGKAGQTVKAMRVLLAAASARKGKRAVLEILE